MERTAALGPSIERIVNLPPGQAYVLTGPTASGKTETAHRLALRGGWEILSADSMAVYRGMDVGTAKPTRAQRAEVRYWGLDLVEPTEPFSLAQYLEEAIRAFSAAAQRGHGMIVVGGTGLYLKALVAGLDPAPGPDQELRALWEQRVHAEGIGGLQEEVRRRAPEEWAQLTMSDRQNPRRLLRVLERGGMGRVETERRGWRAEPGGRAVIPVLWPEPDTVRRRIERRVEWIYTHGLIEEVRALKERGGGLCRTAAQAIGYAEAMAVLEGRMSLSEAQVVTIRRTWQLYRRQRTWFRHQFHWRPIAVAEDDDPETVAERVLKAWQEMGPIRLRGLAPVFDVSSE